MIFGSGSASTREVGSGSATLVIRLVGFHRRVDATTVCLVFNANGVPGYKGPGYHVEVRDPNLNDISDPGPQFLNMSASPSVSSHLALQLQTQK